MNRQLGFSLIEMMVAVAIIAILTTVAYPAYQRYVAEGTRSEAAAILLEAAARQEQYYLDFHTYTSSMTALGYASDPVDFPLSSGANANYKVSASGNANTFTLTATAINKQASRDSDCGSLKIDHLGTRSSNSDATDVKGCWP
ncbi:type IV minor pilin protein PilE [Neiella marina]|uniref:Type IV minor pilin protein PilE n=1 Tax=Neiella marina TaxID=508461 RepID=A0A8J2XNC9_9GAMM|nr:type IV pilin protein [Neiella marina]GGA70955.1 type IV minor pilin protein PilE [Neiella marina]